MDPFPIIQYVSILVVPQLNVSPKMTTDTNLTKGLERHGLDRTGLEKIHGTEHEAVT